MNDDKFTLKARRTTRIPLRIPVHLIVQEGDRSRTLEAWTLIVNIHGARLECKRRFAMYEEVLLQIPCNGKAQKGKVVWSGAEPNHSGNYEFGLELDSPENLWGVGFPPSDWNANRAMAVADLSEPVKTVPAAGPPESSPQRGGEPSPAEITVAVPTVEPQDQSVLAAEPTAPAGPPSSPLDSSVPLPDAPPPIVNLTAELAEWETTTTDQPSNGGAAVMDIWQQPAGAMGLGMNLPWAACGAADAEELVPSPGPNGQAVAHLELLRPANGSAVPVSAPHEVSKYNGGGAPATDRLSAIFNELVESALQARLLGLAERLGAQVEARIAEREAAALDRMEQQILRAVSSQSERLERHAAEIVSDQQQLLEQNVQKFVQNVEAGTIQRQQAFLENSRRVMRNEATEVIQSGKAQLQQEATELASTARTTLRQGIDQDLPSVEKQFLEQCRAQTEQLLAAQSAEFSRLWSDRVHEADQSIQDRLERMVEENAARFAARFEAQTELLRTQSCGQLEQQIEQASNQARQAFLRHIVTELNQRQQLWLQQAQKDLNDLAERSLQQSRQGLSQLLRVFGETLLRGSFQDLGVVEAVSSGFGRPGDGAESERLPDTEGCYQLVKTREE